MPSLSKLKQAFGNSSLIPSFYTFATKPVSKKLRHLTDAPSLPKIPEKVSVVVPNYNYANLLEARLNSILNQTYPIYELIVIDDCSTDNSASVIKNFLDVARFSHPDTKIHFIENTANSGKSILQWQKAFEVATGDFLWLAEADDLSDPNFLTTIMSKFAQDERAVLSFSNSVAINSKGSVLTYDFANRSVDKLNSGRFKNDFIVDGKEIVKHEFAINCIIPNVSSAIFRLNPKIPFGKYLEKSARLTQCGDWYFYLKVLEHGKLAYSRPALNFFRIHQKSITATSKKSQVILDEVKIIHTFISKHYDLPKDILLAMKREETRLRNRLVV